MHNVNQRSAEANRLTSEWENLDKQAKAAKARKEAAWSELHGYIDLRRDARGKDPQHLFAEHEARETMEAAAKRKKDGGPADAPAPVKAGEVQALPPVGGIKTDWYPDDVWKRYPIERLTGLGMTNKDVDCLRAGVLKNTTEPFPIETMGRLAEYSTPVGGGGYTRRLADVKGLGPKGVERVENACTVFWSNWNGPQFQAEFAVEMGFKRIDGQDREEQAAAAAAGAKPEGASDADPGVQPAPAGTAGVPGSAGDGDGAGEPSGAGAGGNGKPKRKRKAAAK